VQFTRLCTLRRTAKYFGFVTSQNHRLHGASCSRRTVRVPKQRNFDSHLCIIGWKNKEIDIFMINTFEKWPFVVSRHTGGHCATGSRTGVRDCLQLALDTSESGIFVWLVLDFGVPIPESYVFIYFISYRFTQLVIFFYFMDVILKQQIRSRFITSVSQQSWCRKPHGPRKYYWTFYPD
jgi:hypothetical protein